MYNFERFHRVKVDSVIDGDTLIVSIYLGLGVWLNSQHVRLLGINAPEIKGEERSQGLVSKAFMERLLRQADEVLVKTAEEKHEKYGRFLVTLFARHEGKWYDLNKIMVRRGAARKYMASSEVFVPVDEKALNPPPQELKERIEVDEARTDEEVYRDGK